MATHYEKTGPWRVILTKRPEFFVDVYAHTAIDAWTVARPKLLDKATKAGLVAFCDCTFEQVTKRHPARKSRRTNTDRERIHRVVGAERPLFLSGSGRA